MTAPVLARQRREKADFLSGAAPSQAFLHGLQGDNQRSPDCAAFMMQRRVYRFFRFDFHITAKKYNLLGEIL